MPRPLDTLRVPVPESDMGADERSQAILDSTTTALRCPSCGDQFFGIASGPVWCDICVVEMRP